MTPLETLYSQLLVAEKALGGDSIDHEKVYRARDAVDESLKAVRALLNERAREKRAASGI